MLHGQVFSTSVCQAVAGATQASTLKVYQQCWKEWAHWCAQEGAPNNAISAPKLADFWFIYLGLAWPGVPLVFIILLFLFLEPYYLHKGSNHPITSKLMFHVYLQHPPSCKCFDPWDVQHLLSLLVSWALASSLTTFELAWKTATLCHFVTAKYFSDLSLLCIDHQHLFLQHHAVIFILISGGKMDQLGHSPQIQIESHSNVNLCPVFFI